LTVNQMIINAVTPTISVCVPNIYEGTATTYSVFSINELPTMYGDDVAVAMRYLCTLNVYMPQKTNYLATKKTLCRALQNVGFTYPQVTNLTDSDGTRLLFEFEYTDGSV